MNSDQELDQFIEKVNVALALPKLLGSPVLHELLENAITTQFELAKKVLDESRTLSAR